MKPPWIDQGWSLVAGALTNRGIHPPPTTSRPSLPPRCAAAPPTAFASPRPAATPPAAAGFQSLFPFLKRARTQEGCKVTGVLTPPPPPRQPSRARSLSYRPSCRSCRPPKPTSLAADQPLRQRRLRQPLLPAGELRTRSTTAAATPASFSRRPSYAATAITFAGKSSEAVREPGLTLQGVVRGHGKPFFLVFFYFFSLLFYFLFRSRGSREILSRNR